MSRKMNPSAVKTAKALAVISKMPLNLTMYRRKLSLVASNHRVWLKQFQVVIYPKALYLQTNLNLRVPDRIAITFHSKTNS